ncbi:MAG: DUF3090 domain-containing protein [Candidatus Nanopelagicales bacterium]
MSRQINTFENPERFIVGTVGQPGERIFYLQVKSQMSVFSVALEKTQVSLLCERLDALLDQIKQSDLGATVEIPDTWQQAEIDLLPLETPVNEEFRVGTIAIGFNSNKGLVTIEAHQDNGSREVPDLEVDDLDGPNLLRVRVSPSYARNFAERGRRLVAAGRPPCPFCQLPLDPFGHICPRANGYRR